MGTVWDIVPARWYQYCKTVIAVTGMFVILLPIVAADNLERVAGVTSVLTVPGIYRAPNGSAEHEGGHAF